MRSSTSTDIFLFSLNSARWSGQLCFKVSGLNGHHIYSESFCVSDAFGPDCKLCFLRSFLAIVLCNFLCGWYSALLLLHLLFLSAPWFLHPLFDSLHLLKPLPAVGMTGVWAACSFMCDCHTQSTEGHMPAALWDWGSLYSTIQYCLSGWKRKQALM